MLAVHTKDVGVCGIYTFEVAETKVMQVKKYSRKNINKQSNSSQPMLKKRNFIFTFIIVFQVVVVFFSFNFHFGKNNLSDFLEIFTLLFFSILF